MEKMLAVLEKLSALFANFFKRLGALLFPFVSKAKGLRNYSGAFVWTLRLLLIAAGLFGLWVLNKWLITDKGYLLVPKNLEPYWLPLLGLLAYILVVLGLWLVRLLSPGAEEAEFPDIARAWDQAVRALNKAGIDVSEAPLFLLLGRPVSGEDALFEGAQLQVQVRVPPEADAPLHVYGSRDAIYVTCSGASLMGRQAGILTDVPSSAADGALTVTGGAAGGFDPKQFLTLVPTEGVTLEITAIVRRATEQGRWPDKLTEEESQMLKLLQAQANVGKAQQAAAKPRTPLMKHAETVALDSARLRYLCLLISRDRHPFSPINGVLVSVPYAATDSREDAEQTGAALHADLATIRKALQLQCPVFALVCGLETAVGFDTFLERFPADQRQRRVGQRFPLIPDLAEGQTLTDSVDRSVQWIASSLFPSHIYRLFRVESAGQEPQVVVNGNVKLYHLLGQLRERQKRLSGLIVRGIAPTEEGPFLFGGCYLAATGAGAKGAHAFLPGVFRRLVENQSFVSWTPAAFREEENYRRWARYGYVAAGAGVLVAVFLGLKLSHVI